MVRFASPQDVGTVLLLLCVLSWSCSVFLHVDAQTTVTPTSDTTTTTTPTTKKAWASTAAATTPVSTATGVTPSFSQQWPYKAVTANYYFLMPLLMLNDSGVNFAPLQLAQYNAYFNSLTYQSNASFTPKREMGNGILPWAISSGGSQSGLYALYPPMYSYTPGAAISYVDLPLYPIASTAAASFTDHPFATMGDQSFLPFATATTAAAKLAPGRIVFVDSFAPLVAAIPTNSAFTSWAEFVSLCKANPGAMVTAGERNNYIEYAAAQQIMTALGISFQYIGGVQIGDLFGVSPTSFSGNTSLFWTFTATAVADPRFIPIAVASKQSIPALNTKVGGSVPTFTSLGVPVVQGVYHSISASTQLSAAAQAKISNTLYIIHQQASYQQFLAQSGVLPSPMLYNDTDNGTELALATQAVQQTYIDLYYPTTPPTVVTSTLTAVDSSAPNAFIALSVIGLALTAVTACALFKYRRHPVFVAASIPFCFVILSGIVVGFVALIVLAGTVVNSPFMSSQITNMCRAFPFLFGFSFDLIFAPLFWKTKRLIDIFYNKDLTSARNITNMSIIKNIAMLLLVETAFQLCWVFLDPLAFQMSSVGSTNYTYTCQCNYFWVWVGIMIGAKALLLLFGVGLAFKTRNLESQFNESKAIGFCLYNITLCSLLLPIVFFMRQQSVELEYVLMCAGFFLCLIICLVAMFAPKIHLSMTLSADDAHAQFMYKRSSKPAKRFAGESGASGPNSGGALGGAPRASSGTAHHHHNKRGSTNNEVSRTSNSQQHLAGAGSSSQLQHAHTNPRGSATSVKEMSEMSMLAGMIRHQQVAIQKEALKNGDANASNMFLLSGGASNMSGGLVSNVSGISNLSGIMVQNPAAPASAGQSGPATSSNSHDSSTTVTPLQTFRELRGDEIRTPSVQLESVFEVQRQVQFGDGGALNNTSSSAEPQSPFEPSSASIKNNPASSQGAKRPSVLSAIAERIKNRSVTSFGETFADGEHEHEQSSSSMATNTQQQRDHGIIQLTFDAEAEASSSSSSSTSKNPKKNSNDNDEVKRTSVLSAKQRHAI